MPSASTSRATASVAARSFAPFTTSGRPPRAAVFTSARRPVAEDPVDELVDLPDDADVEADTLGRVTSEAVIRLIGLLPRDQAEAIMLRTVLGFDAPTAARILGKRPGAVRAAAHRGLKQLAKKITEEP